LRAPAAVVTRYGTCDFDITVGLMTRSSPERIAVQLATLYGAQFESVRSRLDRTDMHVLAPSGRYDVFRLTDPSFDARGELCSLLATYGAWDRIKHPKTAAAVDLNKEVSTLTENVCWLNLDEARALSAALVFGQGAQLSAVGS